MQQLLLLLLYYSNIKMLNIQLSSQVHLWWFSVKLSLKMRLKYWWNDSLPTVRSAQSCYECDVTWQLETCVKRPQKGLCVFSVYLHPACYCAPAEMWKMRERGRQTFLTGPLSYSLCLSLCLFFYLFHRALGSGVTSPPRHLCCW